MLQRWRACFPCVSLFNRTNYRVFQQRIPAITVAILCTISIGLFIGVGITRQFLKVKFNDSHSPMDSYLSDSISDIVGSKKEARVFEERHRLGLFYSNEVHSHKSDEFWIIARAFYVISMILLGLLTLAAWALATKIRPTFGRWKSLSIASIVISGLQTPVFLLFEAKPCTGIEEQKCKGGEGFFILLWSTGLLVLVTFLTQYFDCPQWWDTLNEWKVDQARMSAIAGDVVSLDTNNLDRNALVREQQQQQEYVSRISRINMSGFGNVLLKFRQWKKYRQYGSEHIKHSAIPDDDYFNYNPDDDDDGISDMELGSSPAFESNRSEENYSLQTQISPYFNTPIDNSRLMLEVTEDGKQVGDDRSSQHSFDVKLDEHFQRAASDDEKSDSHSQSSYSVSLNSKSPMKEQESEDALVPAQFSPARRAATREENASSSMDERQYPLQELQEKKTIQRNDGRPPLPFMAPGTVSSKFDLALKENSDSSYHLTDSASYETCQSKSDGCGTKDSMKASDSDFKSTCSDNIDIEGNSEEKEPKQSDQIKNEPNEDSFTSARGDIEAKESNAIESDVPDGGNSSEKHPGENPLALHEAIQAGVNAAEESNIISINSCENIEQLIEQFEEPEPHYHSSDETASSISVSTYRHSHYSDGGNSMSDGDNLSEGEGLEKSQTADKLQRNISNAETHSDDGIKYLLTAKKVQPTASDSEMSSDDEDKKYLLTRKTPLQKTTNPMVTARNSGRSVASIRSRKSLLECTIDEETDLDLERENQSTDKSSACDPEDMVVGGGSFRSERVAVSPMEGLWFASPSPSQIEPSDTIPLFTKASNDADADADLNMISSDENESYSDRSRTFRSKRRSSRSRSRASARQRSQIIPVVSPTMSDSPGQDIENDEISYDASLNYPIITITRKARYIDRNKKQIFSDNLSSDEEQSIASCARSERRKRLQRESFKRRSRSRSSTRPANSKIITATSIVQAYGSDEASL